ncbi:neuropeptide Y receptor type 2-like [Physella acuta]|uniref:neuropeptide Y receptor type 2-like n=1 Tax=Physella acuta TaxID=109671 RepID=UPI0027DACBA2|nr:neuropeptide Y receptor type 2-like [Physella acuta]
MSKGDNPFYNITRFHFGDELSDYMPHPPIHLLAICTILYVVIFLLGLIGNVAVILVVLQCHLVTLLENVVGNASVVTILAISVERHRVAYRSTTTTASICTVFKSFLAIWLTSFAGALPFLFITEFKNAEYIDGTRVSRCVTEINQTWQKVYAVFGNWFFFIMPLFIILFLYTKVYMKLMLLFKREHEKSLNYPREIVRLKRQMTQIIITVVLVFFICHTPYRSAMSHALQVS